MSPKITLSIPKELYEKMEKWKTSINFSGVFQQAISDLIEKKENFNGRIKKEASTEEVITRLIQEKKKSEERAENFGRDDGLGWAKSAEYSDLKYVAENICTDKILKIYDYYNDSIIGDWVKDLIEEPEHAGLDWDKYFKGWKYGVRYFWKEVKDKL